MIDTKKCTKCGEVKSLSEFYKDKCNKDGFQGFCKACQKERIDLWRKSNPEKVLNQASRNRHKNREKIREYKKLWLANNPEKVNEYTRKYESKLRKNLPDSYVIRQLGLNANDCTHELIEAKREQIKIHRKLKELNTKIKNYATS